MHYCRHDYHNLILAVFKHLAKVNKVTVEKVMDGVFLDGFEPLVIEVYEELSKRAPENDGVIYCCPECGSFDLVSEAIAQSRGYECSTQ